MYVQVLFRNIWGVKIKCFLYDKIQKAMVGKKNANLKILFLSPQLTLSCPRRLPSLQ